MNAVCLDCAQSRKACVTCTVLELALEYRKRTGRELPGRAYADIARQVQQGHRRGGYIVEGYRVIPSADRGGRRAQHPGSKAASKASEATASAGNTVGR